MDSSVVYMNDGATVVFDNIEITNGKALNNGGAIYADGSGNAQITFTDCNSDIQYFESVNDGGLIYSSNSHLSVTSSNCDFNHIYSGNDGAFLSGDGITSLSISSCSILNITSAGKGSFISSESDTLTLSISDCQFQCKSSYDLSTVSSQV